MVTDDDLDIDAACRDAGIHYRLAHRLDREGAHDVLVKPGKVGQHTNLERGALGAGARQRHGGGDGGGAQQGAAG